MRLKSIAALCRREKRAALYTREVGHNEYEQWIGDGGAIYKPDDLPLIDADILLTIFDVSGKDREDWDVHSQNWPDWLGDSGAADVTPLETPCEEFKVRLVIGSEEYMLLRAGSRFAAVSTKYLAPLRDEMTTVTYFMRSCTDTGKPYIVAKSGLLLRAVIMPARIASPPLVDELSSTAAELADELLQREATDREA